MAKVRAKFMVTGVKQVHWNKDLRVVELSAVGADGVPENERFHKYTPCGNIEMNIDNPPAAEVFKIGQAFYVDFTPAE